MGVTGSKSILRILAILRGVYGVIRLHIGPWTDNDGLSQVYEPQVLGCIPYRKYRIVSVS